MRKKGQVSLKCDLVEVGQGIRAETGISLGCSGDSKARTQWLHARRVVTGE